MTRRKVQMSLCAPISVTVIVRRYDDTDYWEIECVERVDCDISARGVEEHAHESDLEAMCKAADKAEDLT